MIFADLWWVALAVDNGFLNRLQRHSEIDGKLHTKPRLPFLLPSRGPNDDQRRVGRAQVSIGGRTEHGEYVVAESQVFRGELWHPLGDFPKFFRAVVEGQFLPIGELAGIDD